MQSAVHACPGQTIGLPERMAKQLDYKTIREIFERFQEAEAEPEGELHHVNVFTLVVAVALSAQATDAGVNKATAVRQRITPMR